MARILVVEDEPDVRQLFEHVLLDSGHEVDAVGNATAARERLAHRDYDLILTDGRLPDGTGMELADLAATKDIQALIITGYAFILRELEAERYKYRVLLKPIRPQELVDEIERTLGSPTLN